MKIRRLAVLINIAFVILSLPLAVCAQSSPTKDAFQSLAFLQGVWGAKTDGAAGVNSIGKYEFGMELKNHIMARHTISSDSCKGPDNFDCQHNDLLYIYPEAGGALHAIYLDNEGHVIHYNVSTPTPATAVFLSDASQPGPQFRLLYERKSDTLSGKFQIKMPGQSEWKSYLEWSGDKQ